MYQAGRDETKISSNTHVLLSLDLSRFQKTSICWKMNENQQADIGVYVCSLSKNKNQRSARWQRPYERQWLLTYLQERRELHQLCVVPEVESGSRRDRFQLSKRKHF